MERSNHASGGKWEGVVGYSRVVRVGPFVYVSGTTAADSDGAVRGDAFEQTTRTLDNVRRALSAAGAGVEHVVRTRIFVKNIDDWEAVARAHGAVFGSVRPAATMVEVSRFISPDMLVEIEADAVVIP